MEMEKYKNKDAEEERYKRNSTKIGEKETKTTGNSAKMFQRNKKPEVLAKNTEIERAKQEMKQI